MTENEVGTRIYTRRKALQLTLQDIADRVHVARSTIQRYEAGTISQMKLPVLYSIAQALSVNPDWLIGKSEVMEPLTAPALSFNLTPTEADLVQTFRSLNPLGQEEALDHLHHLSEKDAFKKEGPSARPLPAVN